MPNDDFQIEIGEAVRRRIERRASPLTDSSRVCVPYDSPDTDPIPVFISHQVMQRMERQAAGDKEKETGGVLLGGFYRNDDGSFVEVTDYVEAGSARGTDVSLTFTHETWEHIHSQIAKRSEDLQIVGWYHSHPGLGVFMSKDDGFIHSSYFPDPWHVAIVHDPVYSNWGCFKWSDGELERAGGFYVYAEKAQGKPVREYVKNQLALRQAPPRSASHSADRLIRPSFVKAPSVWSALIVMLLVQLAVGWYVLSHKGQGGEIDNYKAAIRLLRCSDITGAEHHLRQELAIHPENAQAYRDFRALSRVLSSPPVKAFSNADFDLQNYTLAAGDLLARTQEGKPSTTAKGQPRQIGGDDSAFRWSKTGMPMAADYAGDDPLSAVLDVYTQAAATRAERIKRAKAISAVAKMWWAHDAVQWLERERLRQIAYGMAVERLVYSDQYKKLSANDKKVVDGVLGGKL